jgi:anti-sigma factor RsiW
MPELAAPPCGSDTEAGFRFEREDDTSAFSWVDHDLSYVVAARTNRPRLLTRAETVDHQLRHDFDPRI